MNARNYQQGRRRGTQGPYLPLSSYRGFTRFRLHGYTIGGDASVDVKASIFKLQMVIIGALPTLCGAVRAGMDHADIAGPREYPCILRLLSRSHPPLSCALHPLSTAELDPLAWVERCIPALSLSVSRGPSACRAGLICTLALRLSSLGRYSPIIVPCVAPSAEYSKQLKLGEGLGELPYIIAW